jgi:hypothetical protein
MTSTGWRRREPALSRETTASPPAQIPIDTAIVIRTLDASAGHIQLAVPAVFSTADPWDHPDPTDPQ